MGSMQRLEPALRAALANDLPRRHWLGEAPEFERIEPGQFEQIADQSARAVGNDDGARLRNLLQTGSKIGRLSRHCFLFCSTLSEQIAHHHKPCSNADPCCEHISWSCGHATDRFGYRQSRAHGSLCRVFARLRPAKV